MIFGFHRPRGSFGAQYLRSSQVKVNRDYQRNTYDGADVAHDAAYVSVEDQHRGVDRSFAIAYV